jgi:hypothetical protein
MAEAKQLKTTHIEHDLGIPQYEGKDGYYANYLRARDAFGTLLLQSESPTDLRVMNFVDYIISGITDETYREELWKEIDEGLKKITGKDNLEVARLQRKFLIRTLGKVSTWYDRFVGVTVKNVAAFDLVSEVLIEQALRGTGNGT